MPVGWPRAIFVSLAFNAMLPDLLEWIGDRSGVGNPAGDASPTFSTSVVLVLVFAWGLALEIGVLAVLEAIVPTGSLPSPAALVFRLPGRVRRAVRMLGIVRIAGRRGLGRYLSRRPVTDPAPSAATARALRLALTDAGVTFVKLGQMLSTRPDLLGPSYIRELSQLHSKVPPQPWTKVGPMITQELGAPIETVFASIEHEPLAAASVGQVHRAVLRDGRPVVVKVQRTDAERQVTRDVDIVLRLARLLEHRTPWGRSLGVRALAEGFAASLAEELDYRVEAANGEAVGAAVQAAGGSQVRVPRVHTEWSTGRLLVMELAAGRPLSSAHDELLTLGPARRAELGDALVTSVLDQVLGAGVFHADLHAGNVLVDEQGQLTLLDFGSVGRLDRATRESVGLPMVAIDAQDAVATTQVLTDLLDRGAELDERAMERDVSALVMRHTAPGGRTDTGALSLALLRLSLRHSLAVPPPIAAAFRALGALDGTVRLLSPGTDVVATARAHGSAAFADQLSPSGLRAEAEHQLLAALPALRRPPRQLAGIASDLEAGRFRINVVAVLPERERALFTGLAQQIVLAVLAAAAGIGGILLLVDDGGPALTESLRLQPVLAAVLLLIAFVLGSRAVVLVFRHAHLARSGREP